MLIRLHFYRTTSHQWLMVAIVAAWLDISWISGAGISHTAQLN